MQPVRAKLKDICIKISDRNHTTPNYVSDGIPIISPTNFFGINNIDFANAKKISFEDHQLNKQKTDVRNGDLLLSRIGTIGLVRYIDFDIEFSILHSIVQIRPDNNIISGKYLYFVLKSPLIQKQFIGGIQSISVPDLGIKKIQNITVPVPPLSEQKRIVEILERVEKLKEKRSNLKSSFQLIQKSIFVKIFGDPNSPTERFNHEKIKNLLTLVNGRAFKSEEWSDNGYRIIRIQNLNNKNAPYNHFAGDISEKNFVNAGDLLLSWSGTPGTSFGAFFWTGEKAVLNQHIFNVKFNYELINPYFLRTFLNLKLSELIHKAHGGVGLQHITKAELNKIKILLPPIRLQREFESIIKKYEIISFKIQELENYNERLSNSIIQKTFS
ncbi:MAG: restriction endonuclease subunit S [Candidatus Iainarchaeum archaeon]|uniref:Restriction endonuclease subunit S n=1 Tax=Candidatus Iainarchaeum sp. TaxID=3101447 RepID=A0A7T9I0S4_9ARCH|nr:MAG: restriction endonuclease subunit S [Candidatus Diapherotrites archaeon]